MLKPLEMSKIVIVGPDSLIEKTIKALHKMRVLHIVDHKKNELDIGTPLERANKLSEILVKTRSMISQLEIKEKVNLKKLKELRRRKLNLDKIEKEINRIEVEINNKLEGVRNIENNLKDKKELAEKLELLWPLNLDIGSYSGYKSISNFTGYISRSDNFLDELKKITTRYYLQKYAIGKKDLIALFVEKSKAKEIQDLLNKYKKQRLL